MGTFDSVDKCWPSTRATTVVVDIFAKALRGFAPAEHRFHYSESRRINQLIVAFVILGIESSGPRDHFKFFNFENGYLCLEDELANRIPAELGVQFSADVESLPNSQDKFVMLSRFETQAKAACVR